MNGKLIISWKDRISLTEDDKEIISTYDKITRVISSLKLVEVSEIQQEIHSIVQKMEYNKCLMEMWLLSKEDSYIHQIYNTDTIKDFLNVSMWFLKEFSFYSFHNLDIDKGGYRIENSLYKNVAYWSFSLTKRAITAMHTHTVELEEAEKKLKEWAFKKALQGEEQTGGNKLKLETSEESKEEAQPQQNMAIPTVHGLKDEFLVYSKAIEKGYMTLENGCYKWTLAKNLLAYMCGRLYCNDKIRDETNDYTQKYIKGKVRKMPQTELKKLFNYDVADARHQIKNTPPQNSFYIDILFGKTQQ